MPEEILRKVKEILVPKLGKVVTDSAIRVNCQRLGIKPEELSKEKVNDFIDNIKISLLLFLDEKEIEEIVKKIEEIPPV
jgi:hypothetical protein